MQNDPFMEGQSSNIPTILQSCIFQTDVLMKLNACDTVLNALDEETERKHKTKSIKQYLHDNYLKDVEFMRQLKMYSTISNHTETAIELFGADYLTHPEYHFDPDFEATLSELNIFLNKVIGQLLKEFNKAEVIEF